tara:strand:+ start:1320 stop:1733 length:414 start_codon:yes stop_codon:yes gene_type:complete
MIGLKTEIELLKNITSDVLKIPVDNINVQGKTEEQVLARLVVCNILMKGGIKPSTLALHFCKHRTNYYHYKKLHAHYTQYEKDYPKYNEAFILVLSKYQSISKGNFNTNLKKMSAIDEINVALANLNHYKNQLEKTI